MHIVLVLTTHSWQPSVTVSACVERSLRMRPSAFSVCNYTSETAIQQYCFVAVKTIIDDQCLYLILCLVFNVCSLRQCNVQLIWHWVYMVATVELFVVFLCPAVQHKFCTQWIRWEFVNNCVVSDVQSSSLCDNFQHSHTNQNL